MTHPVCKHCHVPVISKSNLSAILGKLHASWCPRAKRYN